MLYQIAKEIRPISFEEIDPQVMTVGIISLEELRSWHKKFGFAENTVCECENELHSVSNAVDVYPQYSFGLLNVVNINDILHERDKIGFYIMKNLFLIVDIKDEDKSTLSIFEYAINRFATQKVTLERLIFSMFEMLLAGDNRTLESIEMKIIRLEEDLSSGKIKRDYSAEIMMIKKKLLILHNYYDQMSDLAMALESNENDLFAEENLHFFKFIAGKSERLHMRVQMLREDLSQLREAYQSALDYNLNNLMKIFTIIATIFLPLTLITGWYGMNFTTMPELTWEYGYIYVIALFVAIIVFLLFIFKKKNIF
jgi:magnesium transporter